MPDPHSENPDLVRQHVEKGREGDKDLAKKAGKLEPQVKDRRPDADETYRTGKQGPK